MSRYIRSQNYKMADCPSESESRDSEVKEDLNESCEPSDASIVRKYGGPSGGRSNSKAETDQSDESRNEAIDEHFERLKIPDQSDAEREEQETAHGNETPAQPQRDSGDASLRKGQPLKLRRELFPDAFQSKKGTEKTNELEERKDHDGEWFEDHPWKCETPKPDQLTETTVNKSKVYTVSGKWLTGNKVDLEKIYLDLPTFIDEMKGLSIGQELEDVFNSTLLKAITKPSPHVLEIFQKHNLVLSKDKPSERQQNENNDLKAFSLQQNTLQPSEESYWFFDCEYMLKMYLPDDSLEWFKTDNQQGKRIRETEKKEKRWIFIPSFRRAKIALLDWPQDDIVTQESTIRILVVRPSEFEEYVFYCGHEFPIICLPQDEIGAGYPRYWIQKIALRLELQFIWMIDDSVECFYEYHPEQEPPERQDGDETVRDYTNYRRRKFGLVFKRIEDFFKEADKAEESDESDEAEEKPVAMSPRRWNPTSRPQKPFSCMPPQCAVYLNLRKLSKKNVYYRPELKTFEDMIFGYECEKNGLKVYRDNRILLYDHNWKNTGASSPSVISK